MNVTRLMHQCLVIDENAAISPGTLFSKSTTHATLAASDNENNNMEIVSFESRALTHALLIQLDYCKINQKLNMYNSTALVTESEQF